MGAESFDKKNLETLLVERIEWNFKSLSVLLVVLAGGHLFLVPSPFEKPPELKISKEVRRTTTETL
jgi:hypothetical protein